MSNTSCKLAHITDTHIRKSYEGDAMQAIFTKGDDPAAKFKAMLEKVIRQKADCLIISGDIVHEGGKEDYNYVREMVDEVIGDRAKVIYVCGNHDRKKAFREGLPVSCETSDIHYVEYVKDYRIVVLDSSVEGRENGSISRDQELWLQEVLRENYGCGTILTFHHPVVWDIPQLAMQVTPECEEIIRSSDVIGIFCGHTHSNNICAWNGKVQYTADAMAFGMEMREKTIAFVEKAGMNFYQIENGSISTHVEPLNLDTKVLAELDIAEMMKFMK